MGANPYANLLSFVVDPQRDGIANALWKNVSGTPAVVSSKFRFNTAEGLVRADLFQGRFEFSMNFPLSTEIETAVFTGEGLDDLTAGGTYSGGLVSAVYVVTIDLADTTDTFKWSKNGVEQATGVSITGSAQDLDDGVTVTFGATTGHTVDEYWTITVSIETPADFANDVEFGLKNLALGTKDAIRVFADKSENTFSFITYDHNGTAQTTVITWQGASWNGSQTRFVIEWFNDRVVLSIAGASPIVLADHKTRVPQAPLNPYVKVVGADDIDVDYILVEKSRTNSIMLI